MSQTNETNKPETNMERLKEEASSCGPGCNCNTGASGRARWVLGAIIIVVAGVLVARAAMKSDSVSAQKADTAFGAMAGAEPAAQPSDDASKAATSAPLPNENPAESDQSGPQDTGDKQERGSVVCGELIQSLGDLNQKAMDRDGVFVFLAGNNAGENREVASVIEKGAATLRGRKINMGVFTLETGSSQYADLAKQVAPPCVLALAKGRGSSAVSDDITEAKLMQAFVTASSAGGGCCPSGASSAGCK